MEASQTAYDVTTPLLRQVPQTALDAVFGAAALVSPDLKLAVVGRGWDEFMARSGRGDLARNALLGSTILLFFRNEEQRRVFESLLHSMHSDELGVHNQVVDLGTKEKPFYVQLHVQGLWQDGIFAGYYVHCLDITREHSNRLTLIDRERELQTGRESVEKGQQQSQQLSEKLRVASEEIAQREAQLKKMTEKSVRLEKSSKEALERAEKSVEKSSRLQHELDKLRKQFTDNTSAIAELEARRDENATLSAQIMSLQGTIDELQTELNSTKQSASEHESATSSAAQVISELKSQIDSLKDGHDSEMNSAAREIAQLKAQVDSLRSGLDTETSAAESEIAELKAQIKNLSLESESASLAASQEIAKLTAVVNELQSGKATEAGAAEKEVAELKALVTSLKSANTHAESDIDSLTQALAKSKLENHALRDELETLQNAPSPVIETAPVASVADEFLSFLTQRACFLDADGKIVCATGSFWEQLGVIPEQGVGKSFTQWLGESEVKVFNSWLKSKTETCCEVTALDSGTWRACAVTDADGQWLWASVEEHQVRPQSIPTMTQIEFAPQPPSQVRILSREMADEFSNLLTGVLGHASLAAAEQEGATSREILEIEKSAREAAQLVRKMAALGGQGRHAHENDLAASLQQFVKKLPTGFYAERPQVVLCDEACRIYAEANGLRLTLDAISNHARENLDKNGHVCYTLSHAGTQATVSLSYDGPANTPAGWVDGLPPMIGQLGWDLVFAREIVRGMGGTLELSEDGSHTVLWMTLPLARDRMPA